MADLDLLAASLRADAADGPVFVDALAGKLEHALPGRVSVRRRRAGLFGGERRARSLSVDLDGRRFALVLEGAAARATRGRLSAGIVIKTEELDLEQWIGELVQGAAAEASRSEEANRALARLLGA